MLQRRFKIRVTIFARVNTALNPYVLLFKETLERQGIEVRLEREFNLRWLLSRGKACDCIHLQWINAAYSPSKRNIRSGLLKRLMDNRFGSVFLSVIQLINFSVALLVAKTQGKIIVYTVHDLKTFGEKSWRLIMLRRMAHHIILLVSDNIHVHNQYSRKFLITKYNRRDGITVIPHGNYIGYYPNHISKLEARRQLGLPSDAFVYLFLGLLRPYKGLEDLFDAFKKLKSPDVRLLIAGRNFGHPDFESTLLDLSRHNSSIKLVPEFIPDEAIQLYMNACDVFVLPYKHITTSGAAALALSFGRPIIAPAITSFLELITPETGILYDPSRPDGLFSALQQARAQSWSESDIFDYAHQFDWDKLGPQLLALYNRHNRRRR